MSAFTMLVEDVRYIRGKVDELDKKVSKVDSEGCAKAATHEDVERRLRRIEEIVAKASGAVVILLLACSFVGGVAGLLISWLSRPAAPGGAS